ncbi:MAG: hypothetical protein Q9190_000940 [Brigantiaea leucoxantha]
MTLFLLDLFRNSEPLPSVHILLETEYPQLSGQVSLDFLNYIQSAFHGHGELFFDPSKDLQNEGLAGDIITFNVNMGCGRTKSGDERCLQGWDNVFGGKTVCPHLQAVETGRPIQPKPWHPSTSSESQEPTRKDDWLVKHEMEMRHQAEENLRAYIRYAATNETSLSCDKSLSIAAGQPRYLAMPQQDISMPIRPTFKTSDPPPSPDRSDSESAFKNLRPLLWTPAPPSPP